MIPRRLLASLAVSAFCGTATLQAVTPAMAQAVPAADAQSLGIVAAAEAFLGTLTDTQRQAVLFAFDDAEQRVRWSNFPDGAAERRGLRWGDMDAAQREALTALLGTVLSPEGVAMVQNQMAADDAVAAANTAAPTPGRPPVNFGSAFYYVSFVGTPSATAPWMLQFGGHHLAINATVVGPDVAFSPLLSGGEPLRITRDGAEINIVQDELDHALAMITSLTDAQRARAVIAEERINLILGPGKDGMVLPPEGLPGADMTEAQKAQLLALIGARLGVMNADDFAARMATVSAGIDETYFAWWGPVAPGEAAYFRITGPNLIIEFSPEDNDGDATNHAHNIYRDPTNEYGAALTALE